MKERINHMRKLNNTIDIIIGRIVRFRLDTDKKKTIIYTIIAFLVLFVAPAIGETYQHQYKQLCTIYEVYDDGIVDLIDPTGEVFCIDTIKYDEYTEWLGDDYKVGDAYMVKFFDNLTDYDRTDDMIVNIKRVD